MGRAHQYGGERPGRDTAASADGGAPPPGWSPSRGYIYPPHRRPLGALTLVRCAGAGRRNRRGAVLSYPSASGLGGRSPRDSPVQVAGSWLARPGAGCPPARPSGSYGARPRLVPTAYRHSDPPVRALGVVSRLRFGDSTRVRPTNTLLDRARKAAAMTHRGAPLRRMLFPACELPSATRVRRCGRNRRAFGRSVRPRRVATRRTGRPGVTGGGLKGCAVRTPAGGSPRPVRVTLPGARPPRREIAPRDDGATPSWDPVLKRLSMLDFGV